MSTSGGRAGAATIFAVSLSSPEGMEEGKSLGMVVCGTPAESVVVIAGGAGLSGTSGRAEVGGVMV